MTGKIIKGIAGFYYVHANGTIYECKAKGAFRNRKVKPLVGDNVEIAILDEEKLLGNIEDILPRRNELLRPQVSNVDQAVLIFALRDPEPNMGLLHRFLLRMQWEDVPAILAFNKQDLACDADITHMEEVFGNSGCKILFISAERGEGLEELKSLMEGKTTVLAGPSGVGKSTTLNFLMGEERMATGEISEKIGRGKHTTRHSELFSLGGDTYVMDTPGFTSLNVDEVDVERLHYYFEEFSPYEGKCHFDSCVHVNEPKCAVKEALEAGRINRERYEGYKEIYEELKNLKKY
ncbi:MAG: ribosome small subunit-dependent GTPase A [Lachnospiraceae bacterium]|nr:ribosome small subunit-dependent GTPase A [Lachnospiraceae bacterium]